jgi:hypothetical protein
LCTDLSSLKDGGGRKERRERRERNRKEENDGKEWYARGSPNQA